MFCKDERRETCEDARRYRGNVQTVRLSPSYSGEDQCSTKDWEESATSESKACPASAIENILSPDLDERFIRFVDHQKNIF